MIFYVRLLRYEVFSCRSTLHFTASHFTSCTASHTSLHCITLHIMHYSTSCTASHTALHCITLHIMHCITHFTSLRHTSHHALHHTSHHALQHIMHCITHCISPCIIECFPNLFTASLTNSLHYITFLIYYIAQPNSILKNLETIMTKEEYARDITMLYQRMKVMPSDFASKKEAMTEFNKGQDEIAEQLKTSIKPEHIKSEPVTKKAKIVSAIKKSVFAGTPLASSSITSSSFISLTVQRDIIKIHDSDYSDTMLDCID